jgi:hypothetical protein
MDGKIRHPTVGRQWKYFDLTHQKNFFNDPRNIRFGLSTDGMNPFREKEPTQCVINYYVHIQSPTVVVPQMKVSFISNPRIQT